MATRPATRVASSERELHNNRPSSLACTECRKKHLKCNASTPICSRCFERGLVCAYTPSRRGRRGSATRHSTPASALRESRQNRLSEQCHGATGPLTPPSLLSPSFEITADPSIDWLGPETGLQPKPYENLQQQSKEPTTHPTLSSDKVEYLTNLFYLHFYSTHPFLLPRSRYKSSMYPPYLALVVQLIGSHFTPMISSDALRDAVDAALTTVSERSVFLVQSLLLYALALHARLEAAKAVKVLARASALAIELGLNRAEFASTYGMQDVLVEESFRRTWWELYVVDGYFSALHRYPTFKCNTVELTVGLPCEDKMYVEGIQLPRPATLDQFDRRFFANDDQHFTSACYRIGAIRMIARAMAVQEFGEEGVDNLQAVDNAIAAWKFHLPDEKARTLESTGEVDQMMLQARSFINLASIRLHFPRSELLLKLPFVTHIACLESVSQASPKSVHHSAKAISASKELSDLAALPVDKHSPLFVCGLVFGCIVQLSACAAQGHDCTVEHHERVALMTGVLKQMSSTWPLSLDALRHLNAIANEVFNPRPITNPRTRQSPSDSAIDMTDASETFSWLEQFFVGDPNGQYIFDRGNSGVQLNSMSAF
ncbi:hypothetical protein K432DRAFT_309837 [Lepidopterella palustris CBS 459.81]|uniref:Zn(2)-C6 fungal-type domain-containing protein n=1 Tax=Lepidopterella palustris CBS 459.81 TaxID=1314670 RepID=A0A8E2J9X7_9PEZI|nr:hypothetical protein K432DRAFT_309837 [Lepidopterella palustris CBS 459.81]